MKPHKKYGTIDVKEQIKAAKEQGCGTIFIMESQAARIPIVNGIDLFGQKVSQETCPFP